MKATARKVALAIAGLVALPAAAETPDYFVEWVQPESKLYVDTGIIGKAGMKAALEFQNVSSGNFPCMLGSAKILDNGSWHHFGLCAFWGESMRFWYGTTYNSNGYGYVPYTYDFKTECTVAPDGMLSATCTKIDGSTETGSADWRESFGAIDTEATMYLFAEHAKNPKSGAEIVENYHYGRLYHCAIYEYDSSSEDYVLASEFKPCVKDGVAGVYKTSTGEILYPAGGTLKAGPAKNDSTWAAGAKIGALEHPRTQWGRISYGSSRGGMGNGAWRNIDVSEYVPMGEGDIDGLLDSSWRDANLRWSQVRFDGWFQVSAEKAGTWSINQKFDDYFALFIDGSTVICNNSYTDEANSTVEVAEGWHRFTIIAGDTFGGYGPNKDFGEGLGVIPFTVTVNEATYAFNETNFPQGSGENKVTLEANADWTEYPAVLLSHGATLDLNGHILTVKDIASDGFVGAMVTNSAARKSVIVLPSAPSETAVVKSGLVQGAGANIFLVQEGTVSATTAYWTGDACDGDALNPANWVNPLTMDNIVPDAMYDVVFRDGVSVDLQIPSGSTFACKSMTIGDCKLTADCDWTGLSVVPVVSGTVDLDGFSLALPRLSAAEGATFSNSAASPSYVKFPAGKDDYPDDLNEQLFCDGYDNISLSGNVEFSLERSDDATFSGWVAPGAGGKNARYFQTGGEVTAVNVSLGTSGSRGELVVTSGTFATTEGGFVFLGANGGTGVIDVGGDATVTFVGPVNAGSNLSAHDNHGEIYVRDNGVLNANGEYGGRAIGLGYNGGYDRSCFMEQSGGTVNTGDKNVVVGVGNTGRYTMSGGVLNAGNILVAESTQNGTFNQSAGTVNTKWELHLGRWNGAKGVYTMDGGQLNVGTQMYVGPDGYGSFVQNGGDVKILNGDVRPGHNATGVGVYTLNSGTLRPKYWFQIGWNGTGRFVQNGGEAILTGQNNNWVCLGESNGNATYEMNGGYLEAQNGVYLSHTGAASAMFIMNGGTVVVPTFVEGTSAANSTLVLGGGTIKAAAAGATIFNSIDNIIYSGDFTLDTDGKDVGISGTGSETALSGSKFTKAGEGTLTADTLPAASTVKIAAGTLALSNGGDNTAAAGVESLAHRWSFNDGTLVDSVTGSAAGTRNVGDNEISDGMLHLPGAAKGTRHVDLGANPITTDSATLEFWFTPRVNTVWPKMFCLGANNGNVFAFTTFRNSNGGPSGIDLYPDGGTWTGTGTLSVGVKYHLAVVFDYNGETGVTVLRAYCFDTTTGLPAGTIEQTLENWRFTDKITQNYFCLGYSFWGDGDANIDYDEVRVWNKALTRTEVERNLATGPDAAFETGDTGRTIELGAATEATLAHRWTFDDGTLADSVTGSAEGTRNVGDNEISGGMLRLPGGARNTKHVDLGANKVATDSATLEFWFTPRANTVWTKLFSLGRDTGSVVTHTMFRDSNGGASGVDVAPGGGTYYGTGTLAVDANYYMAMTFDYDEATGSTAVKAYCYDADTGAAVGAISQTLENWKLTEKITQTYFCLGASFWNDPDAALDVDEVRVWNGALSPAIIYRNLKNGPGVALPTAEDGDAEVAVLDLGGKTLERQALSLKSGTLQNGTLKVAGTVGFSAGDYIVNKGALDLTGSSISIADSANLRPCVLIKNVNSGTITGVPKRGNLPRGWNVQKNANGDLILVKSGMVMFIR